MSELHDGREAGAEVLPGAPRKGKRARQTKYNGPRWEYLLLEQSSVCAKTGLEWGPEFYGSQGWELVAVVRATETIDRMWFKRLCTTDAQPTKGTP